jgi:hypothetical protein
MPNFYFQGGSQPNLKFLAFLVVGGEEIAIWDAIRLGLVRSYIPQDKQMSAYTFDTNHPVIKIFLYQSFTKDLFAMTAASFYFKMTDDENDNKATIAPINSPYQYKFQATGRFLLKKEASKLLRDDNPTKIFLQREKTLPKELLRQIIKIETPKFCAPKGRRIGILKKKEE